VWLVWSGLVWFGLGGDAAWVGCEMGGMEDEGGCGW